MKSMTEPNARSWGQHLLLILALAILLPLVSLDTVAAATCTGTPSRPKLHSPHDGEALSGRQVPLSWERNDCATHYNVVVRKSATYGRPVDAAYGLTKVKYTTRRLEKNATYYWIVEACNDNGCRTSRWGTFSLGN